MRRLLPLLILAALAGCSHRARDNPFDPRNPSTHGGPAGFVALADDGRVELQWTPVLDASFSGYRLYRRTDAETTYRAISGLLPQTATRYSDVGLLDGLAHHYRLVYVFPEGERGVAAEDVATPGPTRPWVADAGVGQLLRLTPDARHVAAVRGGFSYPSAVAIDPVSGWVWISDNRAGNVAILNPWTGAMLTLPGFVGPSTLTVNVATHDGWICDEDNQTVWEFNPIGVPVNGGAINPIKVPLGISVDPNDGSVWIAERGGSQVRHYAASHLLLGTVAVDRPSRLAVDSLTRAVWVTSFESRQVFRINAAGVKDMTIGNFGGPIGIAVDSRRGTVWVADAVAGQVVILSRGGTVLAQVIGLTEARDVSIDLVTGNGWVAVPGAGEVARISSDGRSVQLLTGLSQPVGIAVDPGVR